jgi:quercetin dioxygenase-like cupin family protein
MNDAATVKGVQYVYDFDELAEVPSAQTSLKVTARKLLSGPDIRSGKSSTVGAVLSGRNLICTLGRQAQGTGAKAHTHPNEQFNYILQGVMMSDIEGDRVFATPGTILHTPGMAVHTGLACPDEDLVFLAIKDTRHGIVGPPVDGKYDGPNCLPGFSSRSQEPRQTTAEVMDESRRLPPGPGMRYVYDMSDASDGARGPASARVQPRGALRLPPGVTGKALTGELLHVGVLQLAPGARIPRHHHANEQLTFVVQGQLEAEIDGAAVQIRERCMLHIPAGVQHELVAPSGALIVTAQDNGREYSA